MFVVCTVQPFQEIFFTSGATELGTKFLCLDSINFEVKS